ncbi:hypothetical protein X777_00229 [Ooceraea biroi]|uniref:Retrotransposon gag domain-containing protein n=1 Tax=Ooceraea biroi TaxID=2015173 RepID=A0A026VU37_OOCBI|nr:hypothetical protein X777_00229 [Ooceraea biroi]
MNPTGPESTAKVVNQIRKWGCHFDGRDPVAFLERLDELKEGYGYTDPQMLCGLPELFRGEALLWCRNNRSAWRTWEDFVQDFREFYSTYHAGIAHSSCARYRRGTRRRANPIVNSRTI